MKKLNTIFSFVLLSFCLLINVSTAEIVANQSYHGTGSSEEQISVDWNATYVEGYTYDLVSTILANYERDTTNETHINDFNNMISAFENAGKNVVVFRTIYSSSDYVCIATYDSDVNVCFGSPMDRIGFILDDTSQTRTFSFFCNRQYKLYNITCTSERPFPVLNTYQCYEVYYASTDVYQLTMSGSWLFSWDGTSYYYKAPVKPEPETPTMPTNAEIASAVQMFYNSVYNLPNIGFKDFVVLYDNTTGLYSYIGHNRDNSLGQVIVEPNGYYEGYKFDVQWWKFYLENSEDEWWFENIEGYFSYFVYTSDGTIENLKYIGKSNISGLIEKSGPWATAKTVIVYSTNDYPVKYVTFSDDSPDPVIQTGTIQGDQYTYDENLDITDNQYNPLDNFISINYPSTLVGNADFDSFLNTFNENKDVLILPQNANWVILANNSLFSHFSSFIIMCTLFIILQRVMRG